MLEGKRALVTGGAGFLGRPLCVRLGVGGLEVRLVGNFYSVLKWDFGGGGDNPFFWLVRFGTTFVLSCDVVL